MAAQDTHCTSVNPEQEYEDIVIEFEGHFDLDSLSNKKLQLIGIESDEPVLRIESKFYKIDLRDSIGTRLVLESDADGKVAYHGKTDKVMTARRVMIKPK